MPNNRYKKRHSFDYNGSEVTGNDLIRRYGQELTFSREVSSAFNPASGVNTTATTTYTGYGAVFDYNANEIDGDVIQRGDIRLVMEVTSPVPEVGDTVTVDSIIYRMMNIKTLSPAGTPIIFTVQLRK